MQVLLDNCNDAFRYKDRLTIFTGMNIFKVKYMAVISPPPFLGSLPKSISCAQITADSLCVHGSRIFCRCMCMLHVWCFLYSCCEGQMCWGRGEGAVVIRGSSN